MNSLLDCTLLVEVSSCPLLEEQFRLLVQRRWKASWQPCSIAIVHPIADAVADAVADAIADASADDAIAACYIIATAIEGVVQGAHAVGEGGWHVVGGKGKAAGEGVAEGEGGGRGSR